MSLGRRQATAWLSLLVLIVGALPAAGDSSPSQTGSDSASSTPLADLITDYLYGDPQTAEDLLASILADKRATQEDVERILRDGPAIRENPVGMQPSQTVRARERTYRYGLYVPPSYRSTKEYALVICLHGAGFTGDSYLERWQTRLGDGYVLACPTLMQGTWWTRTAEELVLATIRDVTTRYRIDPDRIFLTGMSNGGIGTYIIGAHHAAQLAGVAPMAGGLDSVLMSFLENFRHTPVYIIHGRQDQVMPVDLSRSVDKELTRLKYSHVYREHNRTHPMAGGHFFPREELPELIAWFDRQRRDPVPKSMTVVRDATHLNSFGWVRIDATDRIVAFSEQLIDQKDELLANRVYSRLEAEITGPNRIEVKTQGVRRYSLFLNSQLVDLAKPVTVTTNGRTSHQGVVAMSVEMLLRDARQRKDRRQLFPSMLTIPVEGNP